MGTKGNRNAGKGRSDRMKFIPVGITSDSGSKEVSTRRTSEKKTVRGLSEGEFIATGSQTYRQGNRMLEPLSTIKNRRNVCKTKGSQIFLHRRP